MAMFRGAAYLLPFPCDGLGVIDCASVIAVPAAATVLSDFADEVIKI